MKAEIGQKHTGMPCRCCNHHSSNHQTATTMIEIKELVKYLPEHKELIVTNCLPKYQYGKVFISMNGTHEVRFIFDRASEIHGIIDIEDNLPPEARPFKTTGNNILIAPLYTPDESGSYYLLDTFSDIYEFGNKLIDILEDAKWVSEYYGRVVFFERMGLYLDWDEDYLSLKPKHEHVKDVLRGQLDERTDAYSFMTSKTDFNWTYIQRIRNLDKVPLMVRYLTLRQEENESDNRFNEQFIKLWTTISESEKFKLCAELLKNIQPRNRIPPIIEKTLDREKMGNKSDLIVLISNQTDNFIHKDFSDKYGMYILRETDYDVSVHIKYKRVNNRLGINILEEICKDEDKDKDMDKRKIAYKYYIIWYKQRAYECYPLKFRNKACCVLYIMSLLVRYNNDKITPSFSIRENRDAFETIYNACFSPKDGESEYNKMTTGDRPRLVSRYYRIENVLTNLFRDYIKEEVSPFLTNEFKPLAIKQSNIILPEELHKQYSTIRLKEEKKKDED